MSIRVDSSPLIAGAVVVGVPGLGVLAENVPTTGEHGGGIAAKWLGPEDAGKEVRVLVTSWPAVGSLFVFEDTSFDYDGESTSFSAQLYLDDVAVGTPQPVTIAVGGVDIEIDLSNHAHTADAPALSTGTTLSISDALHGHATTGLDLTASLGLTIQSASHAHIADSASFSSGAAIEILSANHGHVADNFTLTGGEPSGPWTPSVIRTELWLDASDASTITASSGAVSEWRDKSGNGYHVSNGGVTSTKPTVLPSELNGLDTLRFESDYLTNLAGTNLGRATQELCVVTLRKHTGDQSSTRYLLSISSAASTTPRFYLAVSSAEKDTVFVRPAAGGASATAFGTATANGTFDIVVVTANLTTGDCGIYINGDLDRSFSIGYSGLSEDTQSGKLVIGRSLSEGSSLPDSQLAETLVLHDISDRQKLEGYLAHKWGLSGSLPANHPYKDAAPTTGDPSAATLTVDSSSHEHSSDAVDLSTNIWLATQSANHDHAAQSPALSDAPMLMVDAAQHAHTAGSLDLTAAVALVAHDAIHAHSADTASFTGAADLAVQDAIHAHAAETPSLILGLALTIAHAFHGHVASSLDLSTALMLAIDDALQVHGADEATLTAALQLVLDDAFHAHLVDNAEFVTPIPLVDLLRRSVFLRVAQMAATVRVEPQRAVVRVERQHPFARVERRAIFLKVQ